MFPSPQPTSTSPPTPTARPPAHMHTCTQAPCTLHPCTHAHIHTCTHAHMHTCTHAPMHTCTHAHMHTCTHAHMHTCRTRCDIAHAVVSQSSKAPSRSAFFSPACLPLLPLPAACLGILKTFRQYRRYPSKGDQRERGTLTTLTHKSLYTTCMYCTCMYNISHPPDDIALTCLPTSTGRAASILLLLVVLF
jgi:hypothetical protein